MGLAVGSLGLKWMLMLGLREILAFGLEIFADLATASYGRPWGCVRAALGSRARGGQRRGFIPSERTTNQELERTTGTRLFN